MGLFVVVLVDVSIALQLYVERWLDSGAGAVRAVLDLIRSS